MATKRSSQSQQTVTPNPFAQLPGFDVWRTMMDAQRERFEQLAGEVERMEKERHDRTLSAIDEMSRLVKTGLDYQLQLGAQWREAAMEAARKGASLAESGN